LEEFARQSMQQLLQRLLEEEVGGLLGRGRYERRIDVCVNSTLASRPAGNGSKWIPLHQWVNTDEDEDE